MILTFISIPNVSVGQTVIHSLWIRKILGQFFKSLAYTVDVLWIVLINGFQEYSHLKQKGGLSMNIRPIRYIMI